MNFQRLSRVVLDQKIYNRINSLASCVLILRILDCFLKNLLYSIIIKKKSTLNVTFCTLMRWNHSLQLKYRLSKTPLFDTTHKTWLRIECEHSKVWNGMRWKIDDLSFQTEYWFLFKTLFTEYYLLRWVSNELCWVFYIVHNRTFAILLCNKW